MTAVIVPDAALAAPTGPPVTVVPERRTLLGFVATRRVVEVVLALILGVGSGLLFFGAHFGGIDHDDGRFVRPRLVFGAETDKIVTSRD